jgi:hypothetical protein
MNKMKTKLLITVILLLTIVSFAQSQTTQHLTFKGIPIDGTLSEFVSKMKQNGFKEGGSEPDYASFSGDFASYEGCNVVVSTLKGKDIVSNVKVNFPKQDTWSSLASNYFNIKELLTEKYGQPYKSVEKFTSFVQVDDGLKMQQVYLDNCKYVTTYETEKGSIQLSIKVRNSNAFVILTYSDKITGNIIREKAKDDL